MYARAALLAVFLSPLVVYALDKDEEKSLMVTTRVQHQASELSDVWARALKRIELNSDISVYRIQVAANEAVLAQLGRLERVKAVLASQSGTIAVLYPDLEEPYRSIFRQMIEGIEAQVGGPIASFAVAGDNSSQDIVAQLKRQDVKVVIALGRQGMKAASALDSDYGVVAGGVVSPQSAEGRSFPIVSLAPDPKMLFERLKSFMPGVRRVIVVYDPKQNAWLIRLARDAARIHGLELQAIEAGDLKNAVKVYQEVLASADPKKDALWLPQDSTTVEGSSVLPLILESSWNRNLAVFSSNVTHVKRGALFSLYPNNLAIGRQLAASAMNLPSANAEWVVPMKDALLAVNTRTASHLGLQLSSRQQAFDLVFPLQ